MLWLHSVPEPHRARRETKSPAARSCSAMTLRLDPRRNKPHQSQNRPLSCATAISRHVLQLCTDCTFRPVGSSLSAFIATLRRGQQHFNAQNRGTGLGQPKKMQSESQVELSLTEQRRHLIAVPQGRVLVFQEPCAEGWPGWGQRVEIYIRDLCKPEPSPGRLSFSQCLAALKCLQEPDGHLLCVSNTLFKTCSFAKSLDDRMPAPTDGDGRTDVNETFLSRLAHAGSLERFQFMVVAPSF